MKLIYFVLKRFLMMVGVFFSVLVLTFIVSRVIPGDPAFLFAGPQRADPQTLENIRRMMGLDKPLHEQFFYYVWGLLRGDLGFSWHTGRPVIKDILQRFPATLELTLVAMGMSIIFGISLGVFSSVKRGKKIDYIVRLIAFMGASIPSFWLGLMLILMFFYYLGLLPSPGRLSIYVSPPKHITGLYLLDSLLTGNFTTFVDALAHIILPAFCLSWGLTAHILRLTRGSMLEALQQPYIVFAKSKGLPEKVIVYKHALRNALIPIVSWTGMAFASLLGGAIVIEYVFNWPGMGLYMVESIFSFDYAPVLACTLVITFSFLLANFIVDIIYAIIDPRVREVL
ncbi:ABC transporter permease [Candidatus Bathyarchaeota archaeon]|nr:MAG: ABC transporter permease [Candidatus Bathyarchaeota archaeon]